MAGQRYLDAQGVADYLSVSRNMVPILVSRGVIPKPIEISSRLKRWDVQAIDARLAGGSSDVTRASGAELTRRMADEIRSQGGGRKARNARRRHWLSQNARSMPIQKTFAASVNWRCTP